MSAPALRPPALALSVVTLAVLAVIVLATTFPALRGVAAAVDAAVVAAAASNEQRGALAAARILAVVGGVYVTGPVRIAVALVFAVRRQWWKLGAWLGAIAVSEVAMTTLKQIYARPRPGDALEVLASPAFPSGHATASAVTASTLVLLCTGPGRTRRLWVVVAVVVVGAVGASRVYLRVHWPSDVIAGAVVGVAAAVLAVGAAAAIEERWGRPGRGIDVVP